MQGDQLMRGREPSGRLKFKIDHHREGAMDWEQASYMAAVCGTVIALIGAGLALITYLSAARNARLEHMHALFKEYLRLQFDYNVEKDKSGIDKAALRANLGSFKMYTLEEMTLWLKREKNWRLIYFWSPFFKDHIASWQKTVDWHLDQSSPEDFADFHRAEECYGPDFIRAVQASEVRVPGRAAVSP